MSVVVVGAGIVGISIAYFLSREGIRVTLLEAEVPTAAATGSADGAVSIASKRPGPMMNAAKAGVALYRELAEDGLLADLFHLRSTFLVATTELQTKVLDNHQSALEQAGLQVVRLLGSDIHSRLPLLSKQVRAVAEVHGEGHAVGYKIAQRLLSASGIAVDRHARVEGLVYPERGGRVAGVRLGNRTVYADAVIVAAGQGSAALLQTADVMHPRKGQLLVTERVCPPESILPGSIISCSYLLSKGSQTMQGVPARRGYGLVIDPLQTGQFLIGGTREDNATGRTNDIDAVSHIAAEAVALIPKLGELRLVRSFSGLRTAMADGLPMIGRIPGVPNLFVAAGFEGDGICLGPIVGKVVKQIVCGEDTDIDVTAFDPARFSLERSVA